MFDLFYTNPWQVDATIHQIADCEELGWLAEKIAHHEQKEFLRHCKERAEWRDKYLITHDQQKPSKPNVATTAKSHLANMQTEE